MLLTNTDRWGDNTHARRAADLTLFGREEIGVALTGNPAVAFALIARRLLPNPTTTSRGIEANGERSGFRPQPCPVGVRQSRVIWGEAGRSRPFSGFEFGQGLSIPGL